MATSPTAAQIAALQKETGVFTQQMDTQVKALARHEQALDPHDLVALRERLAVLAEQVAELRKAREVAGNRLFTVQVAILTAQFALIITVIGALLTALLRK